MKKQQNVLMERVKEAFFLPICGIPLNICALTGLVGWSFMDTKMWCFTLGFEIVYLTLMPGSKMVTQSLERKAIAARKAEWDQKKNRILNKISPVSRKRFYQFETTGQAIANIAIQAQRDGLNIDMSKVKTVNQLLWLSLKLLASREIMVQNVKGNTKEALEIKIANLEKNKEREKDERLLQILDSTLDTMRKRLDTFEKVASDIKGIDLDLLRIEEQLALLQNVAALEVQTGKGNVSKQIDNTQMSIDETNEWMESAKDLFASFDDDLTETPPDEIFVSTGTNNVI